MQRIVKSLMVFLIMSAFIKANAQETIATLSGRINDSTENAIAGASIIVKHNPTGRETKILSNNKGIFVLTNLKAGGPYTLTTSFVGFKKEVINDINLTLGTNPDLNIILQPVRNELKEVTIMGTGRRNLSSGLTVGLRQLSTLPTLGRSLQDFTRLTPQSNNSIHCR
ncbi:MAG: carboxypeptidase-like regulatory domain-containing protein [Parafilimonas sp.]